MATYEFICTANSCSRPGEAFTAEVEASTWTTDCPWCGGRADRYRRAAGGIDEAIEPDRHEQYSDAPPREMDHYVERVEVLEHKGRVIRR